MIQSAKERKSRVREHPLPTVYHNGLPSLILPNCVILWPNIGGLILSFEVFLFCGIEPEPQNFWKRGARLNRMQFFSVKEKPNRKILPFQGMVFKLSLTLFLHIYIGSHCFIKMIQFKWLFLFLKDKYGNFDNFFKYLLPLINAFQIWLDILTNFRIIWKLVQVILWPCFLVFWCVSINWFWVFSLGTLDIKYRFWRSKSNIQIYTYVSHRN